MMEQSRHPGHDTEGIDGTMSSNESPCHAGTCLPRHAGLLSEAQKLLWQPGGPALTLYHHACMSL